MIRSLQVFRAFAAFLVMVQHLNIALIKYFDGKVANETLMPLGRAGVEFFFVLSGFIIFHAHRSEVLDRSRLPRYLGKRACRILPLYWIVTLTLLPAWLMVPSFGEDYHRSLPALIASLLLLPQSHDPHLTVGWTLIHEGLFYAYFSLFFLTRSFRFLTVVWAGAIGVHFLLPGGNWFVSFLLSPHNLLFFAGMAIAVNLKWIKSSLSGPLLFTLGCVGTVIGVTAALLRLDHLYPTLIFGGTAILFVMASATGSIEKLFEKQRLLAFLGAASYAIYLIHFPLMIVLSKGLAVLDLSIPMPVVVAFLVLSSLLAGAFLHLWVERPLLVLSARLFERKPKRLQAEPRGHTTAPRFFS